MRLALTQHAKIHNYFNFFLARSKFDVLAFALYILLLIYYYYKNYNCGQLEIVQDSQEKKGIIITFIPSLT